MTTQPPERIPIDELIQRAAAWTEKLDTIADRLDAREGREAAAQAIDRIADTIDIAIEQHRSGTLSEQADLRLQALIERLDESTWNGKTTQTKNDVLRQANYGVFPQAAEHLLRAMDTDTRLHSAARQRTFRPDTGMIDLSGLDDPDR